MSHVIKNGTFCAHLRDEREDRARFPARLALRPLARPRGLCCCRGAQEGGKASLHLKPEGRAHTTDWSEELKPPPCSETSAFSLTDGVLNCYHTVLPWRDFAFHKATGLTLVVTHAHIHPLRQGSASRPASGAATQPIRGGLAVTHASFFPL